VEALSFIVNIEIFSFNIHQVKKIETTWYCQHAFCSISNNSAIKEMKVYKKSIYPFSPSAVVTLPSLVINMKCLQFKER